MEIPSPETTPTPEIQSRSPLQETDPRLCDPIRPSPAAGIPPQELEADKKNPISPGTSHSDWGIFQTKLNKYLGKYFNQSHAAVQVVLLTWKGTDLGPMIAIETEDLQEVFRDDYGFQTDYVKLEGRSVQLKLGRVLLNHLCNLGNLEGRKKLFIIYYNGHSTEDSNGEVIWSAHKEWSLRDDYPPALSWSKLQAMLIGARCDILLILDSSCAGTTTSKSSRSRKMEVLARSAGGSEARGPQGRKGSPSTQSVIRHLKSSVHLPNGLSVPELRYLLGVDEALNNQSPVYFPLIGFDKQPTVLKPLGSPPPGQDTTNERVRNGTKILLSVTAKEGTQQAFEDWVSWQANSCPAAITAVEIVGVVH
ncbi:MAG: hypothetical protein M1840_005194 [Geoglossum simile]|nr:MAG: hypothetical protein M1840_005194 [Geoglossum simile]